MVEAVHEWTNHSPNKNPANACVNGIGVAAALDKGGGLAATWWWCFYFVAWLDKVKYYISNNRYVSEPVLSQ